MSILPAESEGGGRLSEGLAEATFLAMLQTPAESEGVGRLSEGLAEAIFATATIHKGF